jgi:prepilin-type N-terminal cleavage/methylation domain-containing protein
MGRRRSSGFTLVELMIVVAIIGILSAIAVPAFSRYLKKSRAAEAAGHLNKLWSGSVVYYESDHVTATTANAHKQFPGGTAASEGDCCGQPGDKCLGSAGNYQTDPVWLALGFNIPDPHYFRPLYTSTGTGTAANFTVAAHADLDCDGTLSTFRRIGIVNAATGDVDMSGMFEDRAIE